MCQAYHPSQPQACRDHHRSTHPGKHLAPFHPDLIGLHLHEIQLPLVHHRLMDLLAMVPCSISPTCPRAFVQAKRLHDCLDRTALRQQRHHDHNQRLRFAQSLKDRACLRAKRPPARLTAIPCPFLPVADHIALSDFPSCLAGWIRAKYLRSIHLFWWCFHSHRLQIDAFLSHPLGLPSTS